MSGRTGKLAQCCLAIVAELERIGRDPRLGLNRAYFDAPLILLRTKEEHAARENGLEQAFTQLS